MPTKEKWKDVFERQDIEQMVNLLNKIDVNPGDSFLIEGGVPHAIGEGCFLLEVQEPTDFTMRTELITPQGLKINPNQCHCGIGFEKMFDCFEYAGYSTEEVLKKWKIIEESTVLNQNKISKIIDERYTKLFSMTKLTLKEDLKYTKSKKIGIYVVLEGDGVLNTENESIKVTKGDYLCVSASIDVLKISVANNLVLMELMPCYG